MKRNQFTRAFILGQIYQRGGVITTALIRSLGVSPATAKRDLAQIRKLVPVLQGDRVTPQMTTLPPANAGARRGPRFPERFIGCVPARSEPARRPAMTHNARSKSSGNHQGN